MHRKPILASLLFFFVAPACLAAAQAPPPTIAAPRSHIALSDFYAHDPFILADRNTKTYYLYTAVGSRQTPNGHAGVVVYKSTDLKSWEGPHLVFTVPDGIGQSGRRRLGPGGPSLSREVLSLRHSP